MGIDIESVLRTNFAPEGHQSAKDRILRNTHEISAWCIQCKTKNHSCTINSSLPFWNARIGSMYHCTYELPELCDFEILHEASQISFNVHLAHIFSKCGTIRAQVTSGLSRGQRRITITRDESGCVEVGCSSQILGVNQNQADHHPLAKSCYPACEPSNFLQYSHSDLAVHKRPDTSNA